MCDSALQEIANDICKNATEIFSKQEPVKDKKWVLVSEENNGKQMECIDTEIYSGIGFIPCHGLKNTPSYIKLKEVDTMRALSDMGCYWTQPERIVTTLLESSFVALEYRFDPIKFLNKLDEFATIVKYENYEVTLVGRLHGVKLETDLIEIESNVSLNRLDNDAINERQPNLISVIPTGISILDFSDSNVEIIVKDICQLGSSVDEFFEAQNAAREKMNEELKNVVMSIKLCLQSRIQVYPATYCSPLSGAMGSYPSEPMSIYENVLLGNIDIEALKKSFLIVNNTVKQDSVLKSSFYRFIIGIDERIEEEKLVDFVIAWESILQTVNGQSNKTELSYRFSLNGASISCIADNNRKFTEMQKFMREVYNIRSTIVHGGKTDDIDKSLKKINKESLSELNNELAQLYQKTIYWLSTVKENERPYRKEFGWELLIPEAFKNAHHQTQTPQ
ncbi:MAG: HEPN domain-containing protein [Methylococcales bacterium]|nr:HEPN domain-containing protein [Methylococcales bacterium]MDD5754882.1 HEPN domain-containing protein [Methylococcales bacterium]